MGVLPIRMRHGDSCVFVVFEEYPHLLACVSCDSVHFIHVQHTHRFSILETSIQMTRYRASALVNVCDGGADDSPPCPGQHVIRMPADVVKELAKALLWYMSHFVHDL